MQAVIELGRVVRDRKTMPVKYPLPEIVVINKDQQVLDDVSSLRDYILDELNVKKLTLSTKKQVGEVLNRALTIQKHLQLSHRIHVYLLVMEGTNSSSKFLFHLCRTTG